MCILLLGLVIRTRCPSPKEMKAFAAPDLASFRNRKGCYGIVVMAAYQCFTERYRYIGRVHYNYSTVIALHINIDVLKLASMNHMYNNT